jgi:hypothetical protein
MGPKVTDLTYQQVAKFPKVPHICESFTWHKVPVHDEMCGYVLVGLCSNDLMYYIAIEATGTNMFNKAINRFLKCNSPEQQTKFIYCAGFGKGWFFEAVTKNWPVFEVYW